MTDCIDISNTNLIIGKRKSINDIFEVPIEIINFIEVTTKVSKGRPTIKFSYISSIDGKVYSTYTGSKIIRQQLIEFKNTYPNSRLSCKIYKDSSNMYYLAS